MAPAPYFGNAPFDNGTILNTANPELEPEEAQSHEFSLEYANTHLHGGISVYHIRQENRLLIADSALPQTIVIDKVYLENGDTRILGHTVNSGDTETRGIDFYGECQLGNWSPWFSYSYVEAVDSKSWYPSDLAGLSAHQGRAGTTWAPIDRLLITPSFTMRSKPGGVDAGELESELRLPWQIDLYAQYRLSPRADVFVKLYNLTDHKYALSSITGDAIPQETFQGLAGIKVHF